MVSKCSVLAPLTWTNLAQCLVFIYHIFVKEDEQLGTKLLLFCDVVLQTNKIPFFQNQKGDRYNLQILEQEWDSLQVEPHSFTKKKGFELHRSHHSFSLGIRCVTVLLRLCQKMSHNRVSQLRELQNIIEEISRSIMWVNEREEEELMFDWGDKNIDVYIPKKQEGYSVKLNLIPFKP